MTEPQAVEIIALLTDITGSLNVIWPLMSLLVGLLLFTPCFGPNNLLVRPTDSS